jgi:hypothetical protein
MDDAGWLEFLERRRNPFFVEKISLFVGNARKLFGWRRTGPQQSKNLDVRPRQHLLDNISTERAGNAGQNQALAFHTQSFAQGKPALAAAAW